MNCMCDFVLFTIFNISPLSPANTSASHVSSTIQWSFTGICFDRVGNMRLPFSSPPNSYTYIISHTLIQIYHIYIYMCMCVGIWICKYFAVVTAITVIVAIIVVVIQVLTVNKLSFGCKRFRDSPGQ